jgi:galactokinase
MGERLQVWAPGRVNLIGDHTDYTGGFALPMAVQLGIEVTGVRGGDRFVLTSDGWDGRLDVHLPTTGHDPGAPAWSRAPLAVAAAVGATTGWVGHVTSTLPVGSGLSSSAALEVAVALALGGAEGRSTVELAALCMEAERSATGVPCGILDQLSSLSGVAGHALLMDCRDRTTTPVAVPDEARIVVVDSGSRLLADGEYAARRAQCEAAEAALGTSLRDATATDLVAISDPVVRRRARHVVTENRRVLDAAAALAAGDLHSAGALMVESHRSLAEDFEVSTSDLDALVGQLRATAGVHGARMTGGGFGGCAVALCEPDAVVEGAVDVVPSGGAWVRTAAGPSAPRTPPR